MDKEEAYFRGIADTDIEHLLNTEPKDDATEGNESDKEVIKQNKTVSFAIELNPTKLVKPD
jgi:hypothetical protein